MRTGYTKVKTGFGTGVLTGNSVAIWAPATGTRFILRKFWMRASVAGRYRLLDNLNIVTYFYLAANTWTLVLDLERETAGYQSVAVDFELRMENQTGGAADMDGCAMGHEE